MWKAILAVLICAPPLWADEAARYGVTVQMNWQTVGGQPADPHWSRLIAFAHSSRYTLFADGETASSGLALVATNGRVSVLEAELGEGRRRGRVGESLVLPGIEAEGVFQFEIDVSEKFSRVSFATMLAPSPDWFTGATGILRPGDGWVETLELPLWVWDAGADSGPDFTSANAETQPRQSVRLLTHPAFLRPDGLEPVGRVTFRRTSP